MMSFISYVNSSKNNVSNLSKHHMFVAALVKLLLTLTTQSTRSMSV